MRPPVTLWVAALLVVASFSGAIPIAHAQTPDTPVVAQGVDMQTGDPHKTTLTHAVNVLVNIYDTLVSRDASLALKLGLALSWRSVDPTTWEFKLRQGVKSSVDHPAIQMVTTRQEVWLEKSSLVVQALASRRVNSWLRGPPWRRCDA